MRKKCPIHSIKKIEKHESNNSLFDVQHVKRKKRTDDLKNNKMLVENKDEESKSEEYVAEYIKFEEDILTDECVTEEQEDTSTSNLIMENEENQGKKTYEEMFDEGGRGVENNFKTQIISIKGEITDNSGIVNQTARYVTF